MSWLTKKAAELVPQDVTSGVSERATDLFEGISNSDLLDDMDVRTGTAGPDLGAMADAAGDALGSARSWLMSPFADSDQTDGQQVVVANTGSDMDLWSWVTGQEQAEGDLGSIVDQVEANGGGNQSVELKSHGFENEQRVSTGLSGDVDQGLSRQQREDFERLGQQIDEDGEILMAGCNVGQNYVQHHDAGNSVLDEISVASDRSVKAGVAIQLPLDGIEGSSVTVHPDGTWEYDTSSGKQVYDVTANGLGEIANSFAQPTNSWTDALSDSASTAWDMGSDYLDIASDVWNGTQNAEGWTPPGAGAE